MATIIPPVSKLSSRIIRILGCNPGLMTLQGTNTYLLGSGRKRILLDAGEGNNPQYIANLRSVLQNENVDLEHIIITHWHHDHIGGVQDVVENITNNDCCIWKLQRPDRVNEDISREVPINYLKSEKFVTEGATLRIVYTPGHTTDHICVWLEEENALFSGDCILGEGSAVFEDLYDYMNSLQKILDLRPKVIYPGHGPVVLEPLSKIQEYINHRNKREEQLLTELMKHSPAKLKTKDLVKLIYKDTPEDLYPAAAINVNHHLEKLLKENKVFRVDGFWQFKSNYQSSL